MNVLFVGLGSIGTRHLQNLSNVCKAQGIALQVTALRHGSRALPKQAAGLVHREVTALAAQDYFDAAFITNPTHLHAAALGQLMGKVNTFFIEKPIFESSGHNLVALGLGKGQKAYVAAPMRWCGVYLALKQKLQNLPVYSVRSICSSYLPGWRPGADYRTVYSAHREMGGGAGLDLIHEWDYLVDLFGTPEKTHNLKGKFSALEIDSDDLSVYIARYPAFLCELHLDYFGRTYRRELEVFTEEGTMVANFGTGSLTLPDGTVEDYEEPVNRRYEREMEYFVNYAMQGQGESVNSPAKAMQVLKITLGEME
ncbi:Gfo/Idh/MocA family oxidoreductase [Ruminococcaceae bacterium OttesenSCG-928-A16]|nr:Gfo/Idh/MocA family oxidoreductase [Ruminococcaceae bacterium OttesenSCG-928-A16]